MAEVENHKVVATVLQHVEFIHDRAREWAHDAIVAPEQVLGLEGERRPLLGFMLTDDGTLPQEVGINAFVPNGWASVLTEGLELYNTPEAALSSSSTAPVSIPQGLYCWAANVRPGHDVLVPPREGVNLGGTLVHDLSAEYVERLGNKLASAGLNPALPPKAMSVFYGSLRLLGQVSLPHKRHSREAPTTSTG